MVGWHHQLNGHEFEQVPGDGEGQGSLVCYSPWSHNVTTRQKQGHNEFKIKSHTEQKALRAQTESCTHQDAGKEAMTHTKD